MYGLDDKQMEIVDKVRHIAGTVVRSNANQVDIDSSYPEHSIAALAKGGFMGLTVPTEYGGMGQGLRVVSAVLDEIAQCCASTAMCYLMHLCGVATYVGSANHMPDVLRAVVNGEHLSTLAWSEFGSRSHFWAPVSKEESRNGQVVVNASKSWVTSAGRADGYVVTTGWLNAQDPIQSMIYYIDKKDVGISVAGVWDAMGMRGNMSSPMTFDEVIIPPERALSEQGKGLDMILNSVLPIFNVGNAAISLGIAEAATSTINTHLKRNKFQYLNVYLADLPIERARLAAMRIETDKGRAHLRAVIDSVEEAGPEAMLMVLESKVSASDSVLKVTDIALRAAGGTGLSRSLGLERNFRDARAAHIMAPTTDLLYEFIGRSLCGMEII